jgi:hypothetical protein
MPDAIQSARGVLAGARAQLQDRAHVVATGVGLKQAAGQAIATPCIVCSVAEKLSRSHLGSQDCVPETLDGVPVDVVETGPIRALAARTDRQRPAPGGVSIGHRNITAGTLGCLARKDGRLVILSNNHVLADSNAAELGDPILQPGPHDGGRFPEDWIASLADFVPISFLGAPAGGSLVRRGTQLLNRFLGRLGSDLRLRVVREPPSTNLVDAAIARPLYDDDVSDEILEIGAFVDIASADLGMEIQKSGRTTGLTRGRIEQVDVTVDVQYGASRIARFTDQLMASRMSQGGDSGSGVLDAHARLVGLLFAGSDNTTVINRVEHVFTGLGLEI